MDMLLVAVAVVVVVGQVLMVGMLVDMVVGVVKEVV